MKSVILPVVVFGKKGKGMKHLFTYVRCKKDPTSPLQKWIMHLSGISSTCAACGDPTGYRQLARGYTDHYDLFEIVLKSAPRESYSDLWDRADSVVSESPEEYKVAAHSDPSTFTRVHPRIKVGRK